jgi:hypothetical protein
MPGARQQQNREDVGPWQRAKRIGPAFSCGLLLKKTPRQHGVRLAGSVA